MSNLHRRVTGTPSPSSNMEDSSSQEPLLGRELSNGEGSSTHHRRNSYGSNSSKDDAVVTIGPEEEEEEEEAPDAPVQNGIKQADAINQVWSRAALFLAYCL